METNLDPSPKKSTKHVVLTTRQLEERGYLDWGEPKQERHHGFTTGEELEDLY